MVINRLIFIFLILFIFNCAGNNTMNSSKDALDRAVYFISKEKYTKAKYELETIIFNEPFSIYAGKAHFYLGQAKFHSKDYEGAIEEYNIYLNQSAQDLELVKKAQFMICNSWYNITLDFKRDQTNTYMALDKLQYYIEKESLKEYYENINDMILNLRNKLAQKDYNTALLYLKLKQIDSAEIYFKNIINEFYDSDYIDDSMIKIAYIKNLQSYSDAKTYLLNNKSNFISNDKYDEAMESISKAIEINN
tara:strand:+ start:1383 stop:2129 length:747 start_codon:yes stop_codon:yes gene_type:complete